MRRTKAWLLGALAAWVIAADAGANDASTVLRIGIALHFIGRVPSRLLVTTLKQETEEIWGPYGVDATWATTDQLAPDVTFDVRIESRQDTRLRPYPIGPLGATHVPIRTVDRVPIRIFSEPTERLLDLVSISDRIAALGQPRIGDQELGRALGRILAHEIGHVLLGAPYHQRGGLMRPEFTGIELIVRHRDFYRLSDVEVHRLAQRAGGLTRVPTFAVPTEACASEPMGVDTSIRQ